jgi:hypothetical protein
MQTFRDMAEREWTLRISVATAQKLKALGVDVMQVAAGDGALSQLGSDPERLCRVAYEVIRSQAESRGVSLEAFTDSIGGDSLAELTSSLIRAVIDFFPNPVVRETLHRILDAARVAETEVGAMFALTAGGLSTSSPVWSGVIPEGSHSAS